MKLSDFDFFLPDDRIAQHPLPERDQSRMMVVQRSSRTCEHRLFRELPEILTAEHFLVVNNSRVFPARVWASRPGKKERIEVLLLRECEPGQWSALLRPARKAPVGQILEFESLNARVTALGPEGRRMLSFSRPEQLPDLLERLGEPPLPPYIHRERDANFAEDRERYQTIFAKQTGSIAAPTAGLHFTPAVLEQLEKKGIDRCEILLHVGYATFRPVRSEEIECHPMEPEYYEVSDEVGARILKHKKDGHRLVAVGTTATRALEHIAQAQQAGPSQNSGWCHLFIYPGFQFRIVDGLLTNFHLPRSTLLMLVCALAGRDFILECYREAISRGYRFYSYGDCMLIL